MVSISISTDSPDGQTLTASSPSSTRQILVAKKKPHKNVPDILQEFKKLLIAQGQIKEEQDLDWDTQDYDPDVYAVAIERELTTSSESAGDSGFNFQRNARKFRG